MINFIGRKDAENIKPGKTMSNINSFIDLNLNGTIRIHIPSNDTTAA